MIRSETSIARVDPELEQAPEIPTILEHNVLASIFPSEPQDVRMKESLNDCLLAACPLFHPGAIRAWHIISKGSPFNDIICNTTQAKRTVRSEARTCMGSLAVESGWKARTNLNQPTAHLCYRVQVKRHTLSIHLAGSRWSCRQFTSSETITAVL